MPMTTQTKAVGALLVATFFWGMTFPLIKNAVVHIDPAAFVVLRLTLAVFVMLPFVVKRLAQTAWPLIVGAIVIGVLNSITYVTQSIGLETTSSADSAFITACSVVLVPLLSPVFKTGLPRRSDFFAVLITLAGIFVLTGANLSHLTMGDAWTFACALSYALFIIALQRITRRRFDVTLLVFYQILFAVPLPFAFTLYSRTTYVLDQPVWYAVLFCAIFATCLTFYIQNVWQQHTTVTKAALIYAFEPVFATIFALWFNHEKITHYTLLGGLLVLLGFFCAELLPRLHFRWGQNAIHY